ncbi:hypothetical protein Bca52824_003722 [Brassica carinata]|uniref:RNase H type-1 domain-containing protein n=1 Tax=Brassica carinata TaxID=52824 RepID=A0A8X8BEY4_BRACI|nr:hypothetical protein Bca52824_003722 [Brassica carinata]
MITQNSQIIPQDKHQLHTDAAWKEETKTAGLAWIFTDTNGKRLLQGRKTEEWVSSPLVAEGLVVREALYQARDHGFNSLIFKSDAQILIRAINGTDSIKGLFGILQDIQNLTCYISDFSFSYVSRSNNTAADLLVKRALSGLYPAP